MKHITAILYSYCSGPWWSHSWETMLYLRGSAVNWSHLHSGDFSKVCLIGGELANLDTNGGLFSEGEKKGILPISGEFKAGTSSGMLTLWRKLLCQIATANVCSCSRPGSGSGLGQIRLRVSMISFSSWNPMAMRQWMWPTPCGKLSLGLQCVGVVQSLYGPEKM